MSANVDPSLVGGLLIVVAVGIFAVYAWIDYEKRHSLGYSGRHTRYRCKFCKSYNNSIVNGVFKCHNCGHTASIGSQPLVIEPRIDPYTQGYLEQQGKQDAIRDRRNRDREDRVIQENWDNITIKGVRPPKGNDDILFPSKKRKKKQFWDF